MRYYKVNQPDTCSEIKKNIECGNHTAFRVMVDAPAAFVHKERQVDKELCEEMGYEVYEAYYNGGTIIGNEGDMAFAHFGEPDNGWMMRFAAYFMAWLEGKGLRACFERNDILVDGFKVCGLCTTRYGRIDYTAGFIGVNTNLDHIKRICRKAMHKVPKGLAEFGITTEEVEAMFVAFGEQEGGND